MQPGWIPEGVTAVGESVTSVPPDMAELHLGVLTSNGTAAQCLRDNATRMLNVVQAVVNAGILQTDMQTAGLTLLPLYRQPGQPPPQPGYPCPPPTVPEATPLAGYYVSSSVKVVVRETNRVGDVLDAAVNAGANHAIGVVFKLKEEAAAKRAALEAATREARVQAEVLATASGRQLGDAVAVLEEVSYLLPAGAGAASAAAAAMPLAPGEIAFGARVRVTYSLR